ncbi:YMGG-like glycine zipper-containing protein [Mucilaginibacter sp. KACC 22063]|uniref:YMGG-like glycine zipper-containing protein n=1 Tax=Mucilaginibacter sp. KACC 22063 TaxID=3025666 RepID=UPI002366128C|nr:YMGG-like glycine zipper-containing protein [Mucilaginibacter sp. KACC 22063]WDF54502.1 YMGG-like glycine zipper-containing protein [Mucilaginibacter sp. KACC 22063]
MKKLFFCFSLILSIVSFSLNTHAQEHRKMSGQAKGAIIGGAGGALAGGLIGHGVKGALIGGAIGAGGGYIIGNEHRMNKEKRRRAYRSAYHRGYRNGYRARTVHSTTYHR